MSVRITSTDLDDWSRRRDSEGHLPTLVRRLIMATVRPDWIRIPAAEGVALPGLDGIVSVSGGAPPYVPAGDSVWEIGTNQAQRKKAIEDYEKRTNSTPEAERATTTYVCVLSRRWSKGAKWIKDMDARGDGWKDIRVLTADELALWLENCPGVEAWLREHLGMGSLGDTAIGDWFERWSRQTDPDTPEAVLTTGRRQDVIRILDAFDESPAPIPVAASSVDEAIAFIGAALLLGPGPAPASSADDLDTAEPAAADEPQPPDPALRRPEMLEALRERTVVIEDQDGWRRWSVHSSRQILVPMFIPDSVGEAVDAGHHVVLPQTARGARQEGRLLPIEPHAATDAWRATGIDFYKAHTYAIASRRNLGSLRRRLNRYGGHVPEWSTGAAAPTLAATMLAGSWSGEADGDKEVLIALSGQKDWRTLTRLLRPLTVGEDPPIDELEDNWGFLDVADAWDALAPLLTPDDLSEFEQIVQHVLVEPDPTAGLSGDERLKLSLAGTLPRRHHSGLLRRGLSTSLAVLGSIVSENDAAGGRTGQSIATIAVRGLLHGADEERWLTLTDVLQLLAEAAPEAFLEGIEASLRETKPPIMALFEETEDPFGGSRSSHSSLLWALETLAFSPAIVSRVCVVLARLSTLDPGGRLSNRPSNSLVSILHLVHPHGAVTSTNRLAVVDAVISAVPAHTTALLKDLVENSGGGIIPAGPRYRDWPISRTRSTGPERSAALESICTRLLKVDGDGLPEVAGLIGRFSSADVTRGLQALSARWSELSGDDQARTIATMGDVVKRHRRSSTAFWAMAGPDLDAADQFLRDHGYDPTSDHEVALFSWTAEFDDIDDSDELEGTDKPEAKPPIDERRRDVVATRLTEGLDSVVELASRVEVPQLVGKALAQASNGIEDAVLDLLGNGSGNPGPSGSVAWGYTAHRAADLTWLSDKVRERPDQAARLLLTTRLTVPVLELVERLDEVKRRDYWSRASPHQFDSAIVEHVCAGFLDADMPFNAIVAASVSRNPEVPKDLIVEVLGAPISGTKQRPEESAQSLGYIVGHLLDRLERDGVSDNELAGLEFFYLPLLDHDRRIPRAAHRELARKPKMFAIAIEHCFKPDSEPDTNPAAPVERTLSDEQIRLGDAYFRLLHSWRDPLPGTDGAAPPTPQAVQKWVDDARVEITKVKRAKVASAVIGEALAAPVPDPDGTWPCEAVRAVLEQEQDDSLDKHLEIAVRNQRGATARAAFAGGGQERALASTYREHAAKVRDRWPRTGAILDKLASSYDGEGRREDNRAEHDARNLD